MGAFLLLLLGVIPPNRLRTSTLPGKKSYQYVMVERIGKRDKMDRFAAA
jgi:hypothetical protein